MYIFVSAILLIFAFNLTVNCELLPECDGIESKTFIADLDDCESYIYCDDEESFVSKCPMSQRFNAEDGICDDADNVECPSQETSTSQTNLSSSTDKSTTEEKATTTEKVGSSTELSSSTSDTSRTSSSSTKSQPSTTPSTAAPLSSTTDVISSTKSSNGQIVCPTPLKPEEISYLPNSQSCSEYFMCFNKTPIPMTCPRDLVFNILTSSCDWASLSNCKIDGITTTSPRELCTGNKSGYFEYVSNCRYYYRCVNGLLTIQECPSGFGWDAKKKICSSMVCRRGN